MGSRFYALPLATITASLLLAPTASAHKLTTKTAKAALKPVAEEMIPTVNPEIAKKLPGASVAKSEVRECRVKKSHRASCAVTFTIVGATTGETECAIEGVVKFRNARSRDLRVAIQGPLICYFEVPPP